MANIIEYELLDRIAGEEDYLWQYDYGQRMAFKGVDLPVAYTVHFANTNNGGSVPALGDETGVTIPDEVLTTGKPVYFWLFLHVGENDGQTVYGNSIRVRTRGALPTTEPTPVQQDYIEEMIAALAAGVAAVEEIEERLPDTVQAILQEAKDSGEFKGDTGAVYTPDVDDQGVLSWTNDGGLENPDPVDLKDVLDLSEYAKTSQLGNLIEEGEKGAANGVATLDGTGKIPSTQLPSYVDDVVEYPSLSAFPAVGESGKIYINTSNNSQYRWTGTQYVNISTGDISMKADKTDTVLYTSLSRGRTDNDITGGASIAFGYSVTASGGSSQAFGQNTSALATNAHAEGSFTIASGQAAHAEGAGNGNSSVTYVFYGSQNDRNEATNVSETPNAAGQYSHVEGHNTFAASAANHAEGEMTFAAGEGAQHAEGYRTYASGSFGQHAEGYETGSVGGFGGHSEGYRTFNAGSTGAHVEGYKSYVSNGIGNHAEGVETLATGSEGGDHAEGYQTKAYAGYGAHAEGYGTLAAGESQHVGGMFNIEDKWNGWPEWTSGTSYAVGDRVKRTYSANNISGYVCNTANSDTTFTSSKWDHEDHREFAEIIGNGTSDANRSNARTLTWQGDEWIAGSFSMGRIPGTVIGERSTAEGLNTNSTGMASHAEGSGTSATGDASHAEGAGAKATATQAHAEGGGTTASGQNSHAEGGGTTASGNNAHSEGAASKAIGDQSHAEGAVTTASGQNSHAEGVNSQATASNSHAEGSGSIASAMQAHAEGTGTAASGLHSHSEGLATIASGNASHAEGMNTAASGDAAHAQGMNTVASGFYSNVFGTYNIEDSYANWDEWTSGTSYAVGDRVKRTVTSGGTTTVTAYSCKTANSDTTFTESKWNIYYRMNFAEIVGNGGSSNTRSNARMLDWDGNEYLTGDLYIHCNPDGTGGTPVGGGGDITFATDEEVEAFIENWGVGA